MLSFFKIIRIHNILIANFAASIAYFIILENNLYMLFLSSVCITFIMMYGNMLNDYLDMKSDMISHPNRPLPQKNKFKIFKTVDSILFNLLYTLIFLF